MDFKLFKRKRNTFQVSIGEEGAVVVYTQGGYAKSKLFVRSTEDVDTEKLRELLDKDRIAAIHIYIDTLDQTYVQRTLPAVSKMAVQKIAVTRLNKEVPKEHLKTCVQIGRSPTGRKDWIYTFISAGIEPPVSTWIEFFLPFRNVIAGIYFMPIEVYAIVSKLKYIAQKENQYQEKGKKNFVTKLLASLKGGYTDASVRWEVYLSHNKTGGFRQVAYQDGKIIFSRLLNNINDPSPDVVAGNIEQEIANSIEYMSRLSLVEHQDIDVYLILSADILRYLRKEKVKATNLITYTPHSLSEKIKVPEASGDKDKFADPTILTAMSKVRNKIVTLHTPVTGKVYNATQIIDILSMVFLFAIPVCLLAILYFTNNILDLRGSIEQVKTQATNFQSQLNEHQKTLSKSEGQIKEAIKVDHLVEIVNLYDFYNKVHITPLLIIKKLSEVLPHYARAKVIKWNYLEPAMLDADGKDGKAANLLSSSRDYKIEGEFEVLITRSGSTYEELEQKYTGLVKGVREAFKDYDLEISDLPQNFTFQESNSPISIKIGVKYPSTSGNPGEVKGTPFPTQPPALTAPRNNISYKPNDLGVEYVG